MQAVIAEMTPAILVDCTREPRIVRTTQAFRQVFGFADGQLRGKLMSVLIPPEKHGLHGEHVRGFLSGRLEPRPIGDRMNIEMIDGGGNRVPVAIGLYPFYETTPSQTPMLFVVATVLRLP